MSADFWAGYLSGAAGILIGNPLDLVKVRLQAGPAPGSVSGSGSGSSSAVVPATGAPIVQRLAALATGAAAPVLGYGALNALLFVSYRQAEAMLLPPATTRTTDGLGLSPERTPPAVTWLAGAVAGLATWIVSAPTELVKCRAQLAAHSGASSSSSSSSWKIARQVWAAEGVRGFFLGGTVTALRDSIGYGFYFWSYQLATERWRLATTTTPSDIDTNTGTAPLSATATLLCGGLAGIVTWASVFPLDVIKTRVQAQAIVGCETAAASAAAASPLLLLRPTGPPRASSWQIARQAYAEGGPGVFFRGLGVCSARAFVVNAVQWAVYEWIMRELKP